MKATEASVVQINSTDPIIRAATRAMLDRSRMPTEAHFRRDHFPEPESDVSPWVLEVDGDVRNPVRLEVDDLQRFPQTSLRVVLECAGHRRREFDPPTAGVPWGIGAISEARWTGASLRDVLELAGVSESARYVLLEGADRGYVPAAKRTIPFARSIPIEKALDPDTLLAWSMNGQMIPRGHGAPIRAIVPGWYATDSVKWLARIRVLERPFQGHFEKSEYRLRTSADAGGRRLTALAAHALLLSHEPGTVVPRGPTLFTGIAWGGSGGVESVDLSVDGARWVTADVVPTRTSYARQWWVARWNAKPGSHTIHVRARDRAGNRQPEQPSWNSGGYSNASIQRVPITVHP